MTLAALTYFLLLNLVSVTVPDPKCSQTLDEMNCVNAIVGDLANVTRSNAKDLKFLQSVIPFLKKGDLVDFPELTDFVCLDCQLVVVEKDAFWDLKNLLRIELYGNNLTLLDPELIKNCGKIRDFILSWNPTLIVPEGREFLASDTLTSLDLTGNDIAQIFPATLSKLPALKSLVLAGNQLKNLSSQVFAPCKNLRYLDLSRNKLSGISLSVFPNRVNKLRLAWNPWHCDCSLFPVVAWSRTRDVEDEVRCFRPRGIKWRDFPGEKCAAEMVDAIRERKISAIPSV